MTDPRELHDAIGLIRCLSNEDTDADGFNAMIRAWPSQNDAAFAVAWVAKWAVEELAQDRNVTPADVWTAFLAELDAEISTP